MRHFTINQLYGEPANRFVFAFNSMAQTQSHPPFSVSFQSNKSSVWFIWTRCLLILVQQDLYYNHEPSTRKLHESKQMLASHHPPSWFDRAIWKMIDNLVSSFISPSAHTATELLLFENGWRCSSGFFMNPARTDILPVISWCCILPYPRIETMATITSVDHAFMRDD